MYTARGGEITVPFWKETLDELEFTQERDMLHDNGEFLEMFWPQTLKRHVFHLRVGQLGVKGWISCMSPVFAQRKAVCWIQA